MTPFDRSIAFVLSHEGGYVNDPQDPGGETRYGISKRSYPDVDIAALTVDDAKAIYLRDYWKACKCDQLPYALAIITFDAAVNQGPETAIRMLQDSLGVKVDGVIGPATIAAAADSDMKQAVPYLIAVRCMRYAKNRNVDIYGKGWFRRAAACLMTALEPL